MPHKQPNFVWQIRVDVVRMGLAETVGEEQIVLVAVPFASDPADTVHEANSENSETAFEILFLLADIR
jgi:hypothetical protein